MRGLLFAGICALLSSAFAATPHEQLTELSKAGRGIIKLDATTFDLLTSPKRTWSATIHLTALNPQRKCGPCKSEPPEYLFSAQT